MYKRSNKIAGNLGIKGVRRFFKKLKEPEHRVIAIYKQQIKERPGQRGDNLSNSKVLLLFPWLSSSVGIFILEVMLSNFLFIFYFAFNEIILESRNFFIKN